MDKSFNKFVRYFNKHSEVSIDELRSVFKLELIETVEIIRTLSQNKYIISIGDNLNNATIKLATENPNANH